MEDDDDNGCDRCFGYAVTVVQCYQNGCYHAQCARCAEATARDRVEHRAWLARRRDG